MRRRPLAHALDLDLPAASTARPWPDRVRDPEAGRERPIQGRLSPAESAGPAGPGAAAGHSVRTCLAAVRPGPTGTPDGAAHSVESPERSTRAALALQPGNPPAAPSDPSLPPSRYRRSPATSPASAPDPRIRAYHGRLLA